MQDENVIAALAALAHVHRLAIFRLLVRQGPSGMPAGEIAGRVGIGATAASFHLKELDHAGLIRATRQGRFVRYATDVEGMRRLIAFLTEDCCEGRPELCGEAFTLSRNVCKTHVSKPSASRSRGKSKAGCK